MEIFKIKIFKITLVLKHNIKNIYIKNAIKLLMNFFIILYSINGAIVIWDC